MIKLDFLTDYDVHLFGEGSHYRLYDKLGAHIIEQGGQRGTHFGVWAPSADRVSVLGDFNEWRPGVTPLEKVGQSGLWTGFVPGVKEKEAYKYHITPSNGTAPSERSDPFGFYAEVRPKTASIVWDLNKYTWKDQDWMKKRGHNNGLEAPISVYEVHLASWMHVPEEEDRWLTYRELADKLTTYVKEMGFTHVEFLPISEHPLDLSWGYQPIGYFSPTSRFGSPDDLMYLIDQLHQNDIGVLVDWVPAHFPKDGHGLGMFDGTHLYEHADPRQGEHKEWGTYIFNYGRYEVDEYLTSNAFFWLDKYHIDGLRVDAVASMIYLDYARKDGEWIANDFGGRENIEAINFLRRLNERIYSHYPDVMTVAEESTAWPLVSRPTYLGGLGFHQKWDMGWMHDILEYMALEPIHRKYHQTKLTFRGLYAFSENFVLPLSHDEVVYGKKSLLNKMPGDEWQRFANLRILFGIMFTTPAKKLLFMGGEFGQWNEWNHAASLDWHLLENPLHKGVQNFVRDLNHLYKEEPALYELDFQSAGFEWIDCSDYEQSVVSFLRYSKDKKECAMVVCNFTPVVRHDYRIGVPQGGFWKEVLNSDGTAYGGSGVGNFGGVEAWHTNEHGKEHTLSVTLPPLGIIVFQPVSTGVRDMDCFKQNSTNTSKRNHPLDFLRGIAILMVIGQHNPLRVAQSGQLQSISWIWLECGWIGVDLFFVLSGFLIGGLLLSEIKKEDSLDVMKFLVRRGMRLWPTYLILLLFLSTGLTLTTVDRNHDLMWNWLHLQNYMGGVDRPHLWSLAVEEHFYLLLPFFLCTLLFFKRLHYIPLIALLLCVCCFFGRNAVTDTKFAYEATHLRVDGLFFGVFLGDFLKCCVLALLRRPLLV